MSLLLSLWADPVCLRLAALLAKHKYDAAALAPGPLLLALVNRVRARQVAWPLPQMEIKGLFLHRLPHTQRMYPETYKLRLNVLNIQAYVIVFYRLTEAKGPGPRGEQLQQGYQVPEEAVREVRARNTSGSAQTLARAWISLLRSSNTRRTAAVWKVYVFGCNSTHTTLCVCASFGG